MNDVMDESDLYCEYYDLCQLFNLTEPAANTNVISNDQSNGEISQYTNSDVSQENSLLIQGTALLEHQHGFLVPQNDSLNRQNSPQEQQDALYDQDDFVQEEIRSLEQESYQEDFTEQEISENLTKPFKGFDNFENIPNHNELCLPKMENMKTELTENEFILKNQLETSEKQLPVIESYGTVTDNMHLIIIGKDVQVRSEISDKALDLLSANTVKMKMRISSEIKITRARSCALKQCNIDKEKSITDMSEKDYPNKSNNVSEEKIVKRLRSRDRIQTNKNFKQNSKSHNVQNVSTGASKNNRNRNSIPIGRYCRLSHEKSVTQDIQCKLCGYKVKTERGLRLHLKCKHDEFAKEFSCNKCEYKTKWIHNLHRHLKRHGIIIVTHRKSSKNILLPKSSQVKSSKSTRKFVSNNMKKDDKKQPRPEIKSQKKHLKNVGSKSRKPPQKFTNKNKTVKVKNRNNLEDKNARHEQHMFSKYILHDVKTNSFQCKKCLQTSSNKFNLKRHIKHQHIKSTPLLSCVHCEFKSKYSGCLNRHVARMHKSPPSKRKNSQLGQMKEPFKCTICEFRSRSKSSIQHHFSVKHSIKLYPCNECEFRTKFPHSLKRHTRRLHGKS